MVGLTVLNELVWIAAAGGVGCREGGCWWVQAGANVDAPVPAYLLIFLVLPVSSAPRRPTRSTPYSPHTARRVDQGRELRRGGLAGRGELGSGGLGSAVRRAAR